AHQVGNAAVAVRVLECLDEAGVAVPAEAVQEGLQRVVWPGRLDRRSLPDGRELLMDAAHNPEGAQALAAFLASEGGPPRVLVFAAMRDKDIPAMLRALTPFARAIVATRASNDRSMDPSELAAIAGRIDPSRPVYVGATPVEALATAWRIDPRIVVAGSIFLLGDVMKLHGWS
ncbi:MAG: glutamate ligase domain-containing protein, partial [Vicinamibacterales bacterium]